MRKFVYLCGRGVPRADEGHHYVVLFSDAENRNVGTVLKVGVFQSGWFRGIIGRNTSSMAKVAMMTTPIFGKGRT